MRPTHRNLCVDFVFRLCWPNRELHLTYWSSTSLSILANRVILRLLDEWRNLKLRMPIIYRQRHARMLQRALKQMRAISRSQRRRARRLTRVSMMKTIARNPLQANQQLAGSARRTSKQSRRQTSKTPKKLRSQKQTAANKSSGARSSVQKRRQLRWRLRLRRRMIGKKCLMTMKFKKLNGRWRN